jgi:heptosyltransferase-3
MNSSSPASVLLVATRQIGDVLLTTPLLRSMRRAWPHARIDVLVYTNKGGMLEGNPDCDAIIESDEHPDWRGYWRLLRRITRRYELAVTTQANDRGHIYAWIAGRRRAGIIPDLAAQSSWKRHSCSAWTILDNVHTHTVVQNLRLADALGISRDYTVIPPCCEDAEGRVADLLPWGAGDAYAVLHPLPMWHYKRWTRSGWAALIQVLRERGFKVVLTGGPGDEERDFCEGLADGAEVIALAGKLPFGALPELLRHARLFVGPDTALTHLAAACGTPTLALYGPSNPVKWGPWPVGGSFDVSPYTMLERPWQHRGNVLLLQGVQPDDRAPCLPCREEGCEQHKRSASACLDELPLATVVSALDALLQADPSR